MDYAGLKRLVAGGEGQHLEFKRKAAHPDKIMREIVAFANAGGGVLLVGVDDNKTIPGLKEPEGEAYVLEKAIAEFCKPPVPYTLEHIPVSDELTVLAFHIPEGVQKPYLLLLPQTEPPGKAYYRVLDKSIQASRELRELLKQQHKAKPLRFEFSAKEKMLLEHLEKNKQISVAAYAGLAGLPMRNASRTLVLLCLCGVLQIVPSDTEDGFVLKEDAEMYKLQP